MRSTIDVCNVCGDRGVNADTGCSCDPPARVSPMPTTELRVLFCGHAQYVEPHAPTARCVVCHTPQHVRPLDECVHVYDTTTNGPRLLYPEKRRGVWVLHRTLRDYGRYLPSWTVSHVPTGAAVAKDIEKLEDAVRLLEALPVGFAPHAGFGPAAADACGRRRDAPAVKDAIERWTRGD